MDKTKIYLAGPDVFFQNALEILEYKKEMCKKYGFIGLSPFDNEIEESYDNPRKIGTTIKLANHKLIRQSDVVIANLNSFRGFEPDSGTCYECGYAEALGKTIYGYTNDSDKNLIERYNIDYSNNSSVDLQGNNLENFDFPLNLMLAGDNNIILSTFEQCLEDLKQKTLVLSRTKQSKYH